MELSLFETASRKAFRFETSKGLLTTEDLWKLPLPTLDNLAKGFNKQLKEAQEESFIEPSSKETESLNQRFEIVKRVIEVRLAERDEIEQAKEREAKRARLMQILGQKQDQLYESLSMEEIQEQLKALNNA